MFRYSSDTMRSPIDSKRKEKPLKTYSCDLCKHSKWQNETDVEIHRRDVHKHRLFKSLSDKNNHFCRICVRQFSDAAAVVRHVKSIHLLSSPTAQRVEREIYICELCDNIFFNKRLLSAHIKRIHSPRSLRHIETIECPLCCKTLKLQTLWSHFLYHKIPSVSTCQICLRNCENKMEMREHLQTHPFFYHCDICGFQTKYSTTFYQHTATHKTQTVQESGLSNEMVREYFSNRYYVAFKYDIDPTGLKGLRLPMNMKICVLCREICTDQRSLREHILMDHCFEEESKKKHICACGEEFFNNVLLKHHIFKMKGNHRVVGDYEADDDMNQEIVIYQVCDDDESCEEVVDNCEDTLDDEYLSTRENVPNECERLEREERVRNVEILNQNEEIIDQNEEIIDQNEEMIDENQESIDQKEVIIDQNEEIIDQNEEIIDQNITNAVIYQNVQFVQIVDQNDKMNQCVELVIQNDEDSNIIGNSVHYVDLMDQIVEGASQNVEVVTS